MKNTAYNLPGRHLINSPMLTLCIIVLDNARDWKLFSSSLWHGISWYFPGWEVFCSVDLTLSLVYSGRWRAATLLPRPKRGKNTLFRYHQDKWWNSFTLCRLHMTGLRCQDANLGSIQKCLLRITAFNLTPKSTPPQCEQYRVRLSPPAAVSLSCIVVRGERYCILQPLHCADNCQ